MLNKIVVMLTLAFCLSGNTKAEDEVIGFVKVVSGDASITTSDGTFPVASGTALHLGNILKTGENGSLGVTFKDNTIMSLGPETEIRVDEYVFKPAQGELKLLASIKKGTLHYISGVIAKLKPEAVTVKTPAGIIGVRGTRFLVKAEAE